MAIELRPGKPQFLFKCLLQDLYVPVLAKNQGNNEPIVSCAYLTIGPAIPQKGLLFSVRNVGRCPTIFPRLLVKWCSLMLDVACRQEFPSRDRVDGSANLSAVHNYVVADFEAPHGELVFSGNIVGGSVNLASKFDSFAGLQVRKGN